MSHKKVYQLVDQTDHSLADLQSYLERVPMPNTEIEWQVKNQTLVGTLNFTHYDHDQVGKWVDEIRIRKVAATWLEVEITIRYSQWSLALLLTPGLFIWFAVGLLSKQDRPFAKLFPQMENPAIPGLLLPAVWVAFAVGATWFGKIWVFNKVESYLMRVLGLRPEKTRASSS
jgi:hypothetical protein